MKIGVKIYTENHAIIPKYLEYVDFIEVLIEPDKDFTPLKNYKTNYVIHVPHQKFGFNPANKDAWEVSKNILDYSKKAADLLSVKKLIVHTGFFTGDESSEENIIEFFKTNYDPRIILENLPKKTKFKSYPFATYGEVKKMSEMLNLGICLDFAHAACAASTLKKDFMEFISELNTLKPVHYHLSDGYVAEQTDFHMHFFKGDYPLEKFKAMIPPDGEVTIETWHDDTESVLKEIEFLRR